MNHAKASRGLRVERYIVGELSGAERDEFEEHFFSCPKCAADVRLAAYFAVNARAVFLEEEQQRAERGRRKPSPGAPRS